MQKLKNYGLPIAMFIGITLSRPLSYFASLIPYLIVCMLFFSFLKLRLRDLHFTSSHLILALLQMGLAMGSYYLLRLFLPESIAQGTFNCFLCPAASASPVIIGLLGGNMAIGVSYVLLTSVGIAFVGPIFFSIVGNSGISFWLSVGTIFSHVMPIVLTPLVLAEALRYGLPRVHGYLLRFSLFSFWIWVVSLALVLAKTVAFMLDEPASEIPTMIGLMVVGLISCLIQFAVGKYLSKKRLGESITLGQSLGQKNSSLAIWMAQVYLDPISSVAMASYSIWQNLINSAQLMLASRKEKTREILSHTSLNN